MSIDAITAAPVPLRVLVNDDPFTRGESTQLGVTLVAIYLRVSSDGQAEKGYGLDTQEDICNVYCANMAEKYNWKVFDVYVEKKGVSGTTLERDEINRLIKDAKLHGIKFVVVAYLNRRSRDEYVGLYIERILADAGIKLVSATQDPDPYNVSQFMHSIQGAVDAEDRRKIIEQTNEGRERAAREGHWTGGPAPFGYEIVGQGKKRSSIRIRETEAKVLIRAVELIVDERCNLTDTCEKLNLEGLLTRSGVPWTPSNLDKRLRSESLAGNSTFRKVPGESTGTIHTKLDDNGRPLYGPTYVRQLPRIITLARHRLLMKALEDNSYADRGEYLLSTHIQGECGGHYTGHADGHGGDNWTYVCNGATGNKRRAGCKDPSLRGDLVDEAVWGVLADFLQDTERLQRLAQEWLGELPGDRERHAEHVDELEKAAGKIKKQLATVTADLADPDLDEDDKEIKQTTKDGLLAKYKVKKAELAGAQKALEQYDKMHADVQRISALVLDAQLRLEDMTFTERRVLLNLLKIRVYVDEPDYVPLSGTQSPLEVWHRTEDVPIPDDPDDALWERIMPVLYPRGEHSFGRKVAPERSRALLRAMLHRLRTGCRWVDMPTEFIPGLAPSWQTISSTQQKWWNHGYWQAVMTLMLESGWPSGPLMTRKPLPKLLVKGRITPDVLESDGVLSTMPGQDSRTLSEDSRIFSFELHA